MLFLGQKSTAYVKTLDAIDGKRSLGKSLTTQQMECLDTLRTIYEQQEYMYDHHTHSVPDRIVSVSQPFVRPIVRGKAGRPVEFGAKLDIPALGQPKKGETRDKARDYRDECERVEVERRFSLAKRKCGLGPVTAKLRETAAHVIAMSVLALNLRKIQRALLRLLAYLMLVNI